jgi:hypothetical protein
MYLVKGCLISLHLINYDCGMNVFSWNWLIHLHSVWRFSWISAILKLLCSEGLLVYTQGDFLCRIHGTSQRIVNLGSLNTI